MRRACGKRSINFFFISKKTWNVFVIMFRIWIDLLRLFPMYCFSSVRVRTWERSSVGRHSTLSYTTTLVLTHLHCSTNLFFLPYLFIFPISFMNKREERMLSNDKPRKKLKKLKTKKIEVKNIIHLTKDSVMCEFLSVTIVLWLLEKKCWCNYF